MRQTKTLNSKTSNTVWELLMVFSFDIAVYGGVLVALPLCFVLFDVLHITQTWLQIAVILSPLLVWALVLWRREQKRQW